MKKRTLIILIAAALILVTAVILAAISRHSSQNESTQSSSAPVAIEITPVIQSDLKETISAVGTISAFRDIYVCSETGGRVLDVYFKTGDFVKAGQVLVHVDDELKAIAVEQARAQREAALTNLQKAEKDYRRSEKLYESKDIADIELEGYRLAFRAAEAQKKSADVGLKYAQKQLDDSKIKAPISGSIASKRIEVGEMVGPGRDVANIVDISSLKVKLSIPEEEIGKIQTQQEAELTVDTAPDRIIHGRVYSVGSKTETPIGHTYPVEVIVKNEGIDFLRVGMFARVKISVEVASDALTISKESILNEDVHPQVFIVDNNIARLRSIKLGIRSGDQVQVIEGLRLSEAVISFGQKGLKDGTPVQPK